MIVNRVALAAALGAVGAGFIGSNGPAGAVTRLWDGATLTSVSCASSTSCVAVGYFRGKTNYTSFAEQLQGSKWTIEPMPAIAGAVLLGVSCMSSIHCTAVGYTTPSPTSRDTSTLAESWNGLKWLVETTPAEASVGQPALNAVACPSVTECIAAGTSKAEPLAEIWKGSQWKVMTTPMINLSTETSYGPFFGVTCPSVTECIAVGYQIVKTTASMAMIWNGGIWSDQPSPEPHGSVSTLINGVSCASTTYCTFVGEFSTSATSLPRAIAEMWNGSKWTIRSTPATRGTFLDGVSCVASDTCTAVGAGFNAEQVERWNGTNWMNERASGIFSATLNSVSCISPTECVAVGDNGAGKTLAERWNGSRWAVQLTPNPPSH
jgi:hypothetical protein